MKIEGVVERCAPAYSANNMLGMYFLLLGSPTVYTAQESSRVYGNVHDRPSSWNRSILNLTSPGDHVSFQVVLESPRRGEPRTVIADASFRNWTLEQRLTGVERDVSEHADRPLALSISPKQLGTAKKSG